MDRPDGRLNAWILAWDVHALLHDPARLFQAPDLPPAAGRARLLREPAAARRPRRARRIAARRARARLQPRAARRACVLSGLGVQLLVRRASGDRWAAFVGGVFFAAGAHRWIRLAHLHAQVTMFLPLALLALDRFCERRTLEARARSWACCSALQGLSSVYLGAITALALAAAPSLARSSAACASSRDGRLARRPRSRRCSAGPSRGRTCACARSRGVEFTLADVATYATTLESYAASGTRLYGAADPAAPGPGARAGHAVPGPDRPRARASPGLARAPRRYRAVAAGGLRGGRRVLAGSGDRVYRFLHEHVVLVRGVRALSRFSLVPVLAL